MAASKKSKGSAHGHKKAVKKSKGSAHKKAVKRSKGSAHKKVVKRSKGSAGAKKVLRKVAKTAYTQGKIDGAAGVIKAVNKHKKKKSRK
jgi:hypothetical protein